MPSWVKDESIWDKAKKKVEEVKNKTESQFVDMDWGLVTHIYKNMGGKIGGKEVNMYSEKLISDVVKYVMSKKNVISKLNDYEYLADQLINSFEYMDEKEMLKHILSETKFDKIKLKKLIDTWYDDVLLRMKIGIKRTNDIVKWLKEQL